MEELVIRGICVNLGPCPQPNEGEGPCHFTHNFAQIGTIVLPLDNNRTFQPGVIVPGVCSIIVYTVRNSGMESIGIREFREKLSSFLESSTPVAITRHGETVGFYIPARRKQKDADLDSLRRAGEQLDALIAAAGTTEDELVADFKDLRRQARKAKR